ncbi:glucan synthase subunit [Scheffersomyces amazonensis]|uniref:glucan synthase subunit n=1 Tax=Scheffersomyces amazonensis TaxID=1078765 RepID=UPI00315DAA94
MSHRDLTSNSPRTQLYAPTESQNPFEEESSSYDSQQPSTTSSSSGRDEDPLTNQYGRPFNAYSRNDSFVHSGMINSATVSSNLSSYSQKISPSQIQVPSEFNRYPSFNNGSRVVSSSSISNLNPLSERYEAVNESSGTDSPSSFVSNPFAYEFSPFGGYPASSFPLHIDDKEPDDYLHNPDPIEDADYDKNRFVYDIKHLDKRSTGGLLGLVVLVVCCLCLFILLPVLTFSGVTDVYKPLTYELLTNYEYPLLSAIRTSLIDPDTPQSALTVQVRDGSTWKLVFSDEFNVEGRTFYSGDDQFFTAPDLNYAATKDLEWYSPDAVTTSQGTLNLRMDAFQNHNLFYRSGMIQSWNQFCFTQGKIEFSARLPHYGNVSGLWPGLWTMGNLGRPGYLATTEGVWPYSYDSCDAGITANQSSPDGISYLPGQRLNSCTCSGQSHPNPGVGRGAPEIDAIEAEVSTDASGIKPNLGVASQSLQLAPMDIWYIPDYDYVEIYNSSVTTMNTYAGGPFQQAFSGTTTLNVTWYERGSGEHNYQVYGFEYLNDDQDGYITWYIGSDPTFSVFAPSLHPSGNIGWRRISKEPMSIVMNFGMSNSWAYIDWPSLIFPAIFSIDYVRVYQPEDQINVGCDPEDFPTYDYIMQHLNIYSDNNLTSFEDGGYSFPTNSLLGC